MISNRDKGIVVLSRIESESFIFRNRFLIHWRAKDRGGVKVPTCRENLNLLHQKFSSNIWYYTFRLNETWISLTSLYEVGGILEVDNVNENYGVRKKSAELLFKTEMGKFKFKFSVGLILLWRKKIIGSKYFLVSPKRDNDHKSSEIKKIDTAWHLSRYPCHRYKPNLDSDGKDQISQPQNSSTIQILWLAQFYTAHSVDTLYLTLNCEME